MAILIQVLAFVYVSVELVLVVLGGFLEVLPRALRANLETTTRIGGPAEVATIPEVVRVGIGVCLYVVVSLSVQPSLLLEDFRPVSSQIIVQSNMEEGVNRQDQLNNEIIYKTKFRLFHYLQRLKSWAWRRFALSFDARQSNDLS